MEEDNLSKFVDQIIDAKKLSGVSADVRQQLQSDLKAHLLDQINAALIRELDESRLDELNILLDNPEVSDAQIQQFIASAGVDVQRITAGTMLRFRDLYLGVGESTEA